MKKVLLIPIFSLLTFSLFSQCFPDRHNTSTSASWQSCSPSPSPNTNRGESHWLRYDLGKFYTLGTTKFWNLNIPEKTNEGARNVIIDISLDGVNWNEIASFEMPQAPGSTFYEGEFGPDLDGISTRYVLITILDSWSESECVGLGEVRFNLDKPIITDLTKEDIKCHNSADGTASLVAEGGVEPFDILWSTGSTNTEITDLTPGVYYVSITDQLNNTVIDSIIIEAPSEIFLEEVELLTIDCDNPSGSIEVAATGGTGDLRFEWSDGSNGPLLSEANEGVYEVTVYDENECSKTQSFEITADSAVPNAVAVASSLNCKNSEITIDATGSSTGNNFEYKWTTEDGNIVSGGNTLNPVVDAVGTYSLEITNTDNQCKGNTDVNVALIPDVGIELVTSQNISCHGNANGLIEVNAFDGEEPYEFEWSNGESGNSQSNLPVGVYTVKVIDALDCESSIEIELTEPSAIAVNLVEQIDINCEITTGSLSVEGSGGTGDLTYNWSNGNSGSSITGLSSGEHRVTIIDENMCSTEEIYTINSDIEKPSVQLNTGTLFCNLNQVDLDGTGSSTGANFIYDWSTQDGNIVSGQNEIVAVADEEGTYQLSISNQENQCEESMTIEVTRIPDVEIALEESIDVLCYGEQNGVAEVSASSGQEPYNFSWNHGEEGERQEDLLPGDYIVTVSDNLACTQEIAFTISQPDQLIMVIDTASSSSYTIAEGFINITAEGGTEPLSFTWLDANGEIVSEEEDPTGLFPGVYTVNIVDANNCEIFSEEITIQGISANIDLNGNLLTVYPNPTKEVLNISLENSTTVDEITVIIENTVGQRVYVGTMTQNQIKQVNVASFSAGSYLVRLSSETDFATIIFIKE